MCVLELVGFPVIIHQQFALESSDDNDLKRQNIDFVMGIPYLFSNFPSDVRFMRNIESKTATFFQVCCVCLRIGPFSCDYTPTVRFRVI